MNVLIISPGKNIEGGMTTVVNSFRERLSKVGVNTVYIDSYSQAGKLAVLLVFVRSLFKVLFALSINKIDISHIHTASKGSFYRKSIFCFFAKLFRTSVVLHMHGGGFKEFYNQSHAISRLYIRFVLRHNVDALLVLTDSWKTWFTEEFDLNDKINILNNSVTVPDRKVNQCNQVKRIVFIGRLVPSKGVDDLLEAFALVSKKTVIELDVVGGGNIEPYINKIRQLNISSLVEFSGSVSHDESIQKLRSADIMVLPSYQEGLPMVILEAMACNTAIITTNVGGIPDVINDRFNGLMFPPGDIIKLADLINELSVDNQLLQSLTKRAYDDVNNHYSIDCVFPNLISIYKKVLT